MPKKIMYLLIIFLFPAVTHAGNNNEFILTEVLQRLIALITTKLGGSIFILTMIGTGYAWLKAGRIEKGQAITTLIAMSLIYGSAWLVNYFGFQ